MKKKAKTDPEMQPEYDFSRGIRGKYARQLARGANLVVVDTDVARVFPDSESVNRSPRALTEIVQKRRRRGSA